MCSEPNLVLRVLRRNGDKLLHETFFTSTTVFRLDANHDQESLCLSFFYQAKSFAFYIVIEGVNMKA
jgi:hypothetical protein